MRNEKRIDVFTSDQNRLDLLEDISFTPVLNYPKPLFDETGPYEFGMISSKIGRIHFHKDFELNRVISDTKKIVEMSLKRIEEGLIPKEELKSLYHYLSLMRR